MAYDVERIERGIFSVKFSLSASIDERIASLEHADGLRSDDESLSLLFDMREAEICPYGAGPALALSDALARRRRTGSKVAHLLRQGQTDLATTVMASLCPRNASQRFTSRAEALQWLRDCGGE